MLEATTADYEKKSQTGTGTGDLGLRIPISKRSTQLNLEHKLLYKRTELPVEEELSLQPDGTHRAFRQEYSRDWRGSIAALQHCECVHVVIPFRAARTESGQRVAGLNSLGRTCFSCHCSLDNLEEKISVKV